MRTHKLIAVLLLVLVGGIVEAASTIDGDLVVTGSLSVGSFSLPNDTVTNAMVNSSAAIARSKLATETLLIEVPLVSLRVWDSLQPLPATSSSDDLGLYPGTYGTDSPMARTADVKNAGAVTLRARFQKTLPYNYVSAGTCTLRARGGMITTIASSSATVDFEASEVGDATVGSDLVTTSATSINSTSFATSDFTVTSAGLVAGDVLDVRVTIAVNDSATPTAVIAALSKLWIVVQVKG